MMKRCHWCGTDPLYVQYHDQDWGVPVYDDKQLFAKLILDGAQAGLSWITILRKRENYYAAFDNLDPEKIALYDEDKIIELLQNAGIVRNRAKVRSAVTNAQAYLKIMEETGSFSDFLWSFVGGKPIHNYWATMDETPTQTTASVAMSKALKKQGFKFVGPTIVYAFMQAVGMVNDHLLSCFRYQELCPAAQQLDWFVKVIIKEPNYGEWDYHIVNHHPTQAVELTFRQYSDLDQGKDYAQEEQIILPPQTDRLVASHDYGPVLSNCDGVEIISVAAVTPS